MKICNHIFDLSQIIFYLDSKVHGANMGPTWVLPAPDGPHVGPINLAVGVVFLPAQPASTFHLGADSLRQPFYHAIWPCHRHPCWCSAAIWVMTTTEKANLGFP